MTKVYIRNYEPIGLCTDSEQYWSDVWLTYTVKPGRSKRRLAPTLVSITALSRDLEIDQEILKENPDFDLKDEISRAKKILTDLATNKFAVDTNPNPGIPEIYTSANTIDRTHAEEMLTYYFTTCGISAVKFKWKRVKLSEIIIPTIV